MVIIFILVGGFIVKCVFSGVDSYCNMVDYKVFGALVSAGVLELVFELKTAIAIFRKKD